MPTGAERPSGGAIPSGAGWSGAIGGALLASAEAVSAFRSIRPESSFVAVGAPAMVMLLLLGGPLLESGPALGFGPDAEVRAESEKSTLDSLRAPVALAPPPACGSDGSRALVVTSCSLPAVSNAPKR